MNDSLHADDGSLNHLWQTLTGGGIVSLYWGTDPPEQLAGRELPEQVQIAFRNGQPLDGAVLAGALWWVVLEDSSEDSQFAFIAWSPAEGPWGELLSLWAKLLVRIEAGTREAEELTRALVSSWDRLTLLYELMQIAGESEDLSHMLKSVVRLLAQVTSARDVFLVLLEEGTSINVTASGDPLPQPEILYERAVLAGRPITLAELSRSLREADSPLAKLNDLLVAGIPAEGGPIGILGLLGPLEGNFDANDIQLVASVAEQVGALIQAEKSRASQAEQKLLEHELAIAAEIQGSLLPDRFPEISGLELMVMFEPARQVGGDFYDVAKTAEGDQLFMLADVSGKGSPAALLTALLHAAFHAEAAHSNDPGILLANINKLLYHDLDKSGAFITAFVVKFPVASQEFVYASAGHVDAAYWEHEREAVFFLPATGLPLGIDRQGDYRSRSAGIMEGNALWIYSDGITEARGRDGSLVGGSGLADLIDAVYPAPVEKQVHSLRRYLDIIRGGEPLEDDMAAIVIRAVVREDQLDPVIPFVLSASPDSTHAFVDQIRRGFPEREGGSLDLPQGLLDDVALAVSEITSNQVEHAYPEGGGVILGRFAAGPTHVEVHLYDHGPFFDPDEIGLPLVDAEDPPERGYGLRLAFGVLDVCEVERQQGRKNHWRLVKQISEKMEQ
jgi:serine phosphatase RsbU (regulator of sigma subunit)/anti-sigma regulatory factor (Ser/Thr protein kinase)